MIFNIDMDKHTQDALFKKLSCFLILSLIAMLSSCFDNNEFFVNITSKKNLPINAVLPLIYEGEVPIQMDELKNPEKYVLLGNCAQEILNSDNTRSNNNSEDQSKDTDADSKDPLKINLQDSGELTGTPIPLFIIPTKDYQELENNKIRQIIYLMPEALAPGQHYCLTVNPMIKNTEDLNLTTASFTFEFDTLGQKTDTEKEYPGPKYSDPDFFELSFPLPYLKQDKNDYALSVNHQASQDFPPLFKFAKQSMSDNSFLADPKKIRDSIEVCEILKLPGSGENPDGDNDKASDRVETQQECKNVSNIQVNMIEDLMYSEDGKYVLSNYAYFSISGAALKINTPYQIKATYDYGESKENLSQSSEVHSFMMVNNEDILLGLKLDSDPSEQELDEESALEEKTIGAKDLFDQFKLQYGQASGDSYVEIPIRLSSSSPREKD